MKASDIRYSVDGEVIRVVIAGDVISLPHEGWSYGGFGRHISEDWLLTQPTTRLPGRSKARRQLLARCIIQALDQHHEEHDARSVPVSVETRKRLTRMGLQIHAGVKMAHGERPPDGVPTVVWTEAAEAAWRDGEFLLQMAESP